MYVCGVYWGKAAHKSLVTWLYCNPLQLEMFIPLVSAQFGESIVDCRKIPIFTAVSAFPHLFNKIQSIFFSFIYPLRYISIFISFIYHVNRSGVVFCCYFCTNVCLRIAGCCVCRGRCYFDLTFCWPYIWLVCEERTKRVLHAWRSRWVFYLSESFLRNCRVSSLYSRQSQSLIQSQQNT